MANTMSFSFLLLSLLLLSNCQWMRVHGESTISASFTEKTTDGISTELDSHPTSGDMTVTSSPEVSKSAITTETNITSSKTNSKTTVAITESAPTHSLTMDITRNISTNDISVSYQSTQPANTENITYIGTLNSTISYTVISITSPGIQNSPITNNLTTSNVTSSIAKTNNPITENATSSTNTSSTTNGIISSVTSRPTNNPNFTISMSNSSSSSTENSTISSTVATTNDRNTPNISRPTTITVTNQRTKNTFVTSVLKTTQISNSSEDSLGNGKGSQSSAGVIVGAIIGSALGITLVGLIAYFLCGKKKQDSFTHRRLYEDIRNEPVLRLDSTVDPYDLSYGDSAFHNPAMHESANRNHGNSHDFIPMDHMAPSQPSV